MTSDTLCPLRHESVFATYLAAATPLIAPVYRKIESSKLSRGRSDVCVRNLLFALIIATKPRRILEIGCHIGAATLVMAHACQINQFGRVVGLEPNRHFHAVLARHLEAAQLQSWVTLQRGFSHDAQVQEAVMKEGEYQLIFIDGAHRYSAVKQELDFYGALLSVNGFIVLHDSSVRSVSLDKERRGGPRRAILEFCEENANYRPIFFEYPIWGNPTGACLLCKQALS